MQSELKPCPFCGGVDDVSTYRPGESAPYQHWWEVQCIAGGCAGPTVEGLTEAEAIAAWNRRATPAPPDIAALAKAAGWEVCKVSLYDEEGVEGWEWTAPDGKQYSEIGDWNEPPPIPPEMQDLFGRPAPPDIAALLATVGKATEGEWRNQQLLEYGAGVITVRGGSLAACWPEALLGERFDAEANAAAIVASVNFVRDELPALLAKHEAEIARLREALSRQSDNMAFVLNHAGVPQSWYDNFMDELTADRQALGSAK